MKTIILTSFIAFLCGITNLAIAGSDFYCPPISSVKEVPYNNSTTEYVYTATAPDGKVYTDPSHHFKNDFSAKITAFTGALTEGQIKGSIIGIACDYTTADPQYKWTDLFLAGSVSNYIADTNVPGNLWKKISAPIQYQCDSQSQYACPFLQ